jgi:hypothetical protein
MKLRGMDAEFLTMICQVFFSLSFFFFGRFFCDRATVAIEEAMVESQANIITHNSTQLGRDGEFAFLP